LVPPETTTRSSPCPLDPGALGEAELVARDVADVLEIGWTVTGLRRERQ
jgi:hypothetical protein